MALMTNKLERYMDVLVLSFSTPHDNASSAGEKTHNLYLKSIAKEPDFEVSLIGMCDSFKAERLDLEQYEIKNRLLIENHTGLEEIKRKCVRFFRFTLQSKDKYAHFLNHTEVSFFRKELERLKTESYKPDVIILEFTQCILLIEDVKRVYPDVPIIASSHDVSYMGSKRIMEYENNPIKKFFRKRQYQNLKLREKDAISKCDLILPHNINDIVIFLKEPELKQKHFDDIVPYYDYYADVNRNPEPHLLIFYGSMSRNENYLSVIWFIENVFNKLDETYKFIIIGGNPHKRLKKYANERIILTGFVELEEVKKYFSKCMCMVVPLLLGSGIKVKILEAFSGGVPVITNSIGIEGIYAEAGKQYIHCESAEDYIESLKEIDECKINLEEIGRSAKEYVYSEFELEKSAKKYISYIHELTGK